MNDVDMTELRKRFWSRVAGLKAVRTSDLIRAHHVAQQRCISPEEALVALGVLSQSQVLEIFAGERAVAASA